MNSFPISVYIPTDTWSQWSDSFLSISPLSISNVIFSTDTYNIKQFPICYVPFDKHVFNITSEPLAISRHPFLSILVFNHCPGSPYDSSTKSALLEWLNCVTHCGEYLIVVLSTYSLSSKAHRKFLESIRNDCPSQISLKTRTTSLHYTLPNLLTSSSLESLSSAFSSLLSSSIATRLVRCYDIAKSYKNQLLLSDSGNALHYIRAEASLALLFSSLDFNSLSALHWIDLYESLVSINFDDINVIDDKDELFSLSNPIGVTLESKD
ncbi:hypothetical protein GEMRC1_003229 [Eukaryota sp. GEM-RC1]